MTTAYQSATGQVTDGTGTTLATIDAVRPIPSALGRANAPAGPGITDLGGMRFTVGQSARATERGMHQVGAPETSSAGRITDFRSAAGSPTSNVTEASTFSVIDPASGQPMTMSVGGALRSGLIEKTADGGYRWLGDGAPASATNRSPEALPTDAPAHEAPVKAPEVSEEIEALRRDAGLGMTKAEANTYRESFEALGGVERVPAIVEAVFDTVAPDGMVDLDAAARATGAKAEDLADRLGAMRSALASQLHHYVEREFGEWGIDAKEVTEWAFETQPKAYREALKAHALSANPTAWKALARAYAHAKTRAGGARR